jgi:hypothetical protein
VGFKTGAALSINVGHGVAGDRGWRLLDPLAAAPMFGLE